MKLTTGRPWLIVAVTVVVALAVAGCAAPTSTSTAHPSSTSTPTPTPTPASEAGSRVPLGCTDLVGASNVQSLAGANAKVEQDEHSAPANLLDIGQLQYGAEGCVWDGGYAVPNSTLGAYLSVDVAPEGKAHFENAFAELMASSPNLPHAAPTENVAGDRSGFWCAADLEGLGADGPSRTCDAEMLVDDYWVSIDVGDVIGLTRVDLEAGITATLSRVASGLKAAGAPSLPWELPTATPPSFCTPVDITVTSAGVIGLAGRDLACKWNSAVYTEVNFDLMTGGSWGVAGMAPVPANDADYGRTPYVAMKVPGTSSAKASCDGRTCDAYLGVGTYAAELVFDDSGAAKNLALLSAAAKAIAPR